jgi:hypothetical protein
VPGSAEFTDDKAVLLLLSAHQFLKKACRFFSIVFICYLFINIYIPIKNAHGKLQDPENLVSLVANRSS